MNQSIMKLYQVAEKEQRIILGLMSGTSADGLDISLNRISNSGMNTTVELLEFKSLKYGDRFKTEVQRRLFDANLPVSLALKLQEKIQNEWVDKIQKKLVEWGYQKEKIDLIASHGQTLFHSPSTIEEASTTLQIVDGDFLSTKLGIITVSDFRQKHIAAGLEGAPLAPMAEQLLFAKVKKPVVLLNLGGIANFTVLTESVEPQIPFSTDAGPANTLIDAAVRHFYDDEPFDRSGEIAKSGSVDSELLEALKTHPFFRNEAPKSTGPEEFNLDWVQTEAQEAAFSGSPEDLVATLTAFSAWGIATEIRKKIGDEAFDIYVSGGGWHNHTLMLNLKKELPSCRFYSSEKLGMNPDAKEAVLFSILANETVAGKGWKIPGGRQITLGKISLP